VFVGPAAYLALILYEASGLSSDDHKDEKNQVSVRSIACGVYGASLVLLFTVSTIFHIVCYTGKGR